MLPYLVKAVVSEYLRGAPIVFKGICPILYHKVLAIGAFPNRPEQFTRIPFILDFFLNSLKVFFKAFLKFVFGYSISEAKKLANKFAVLLIFFCEKKEIFTFFLKKKYICISI